MSFETTALLLTWVALLLLSMVVAGLVRHVHVLAGAATRPAHRLGPPAGAPAPALDRLRPAAERPTLLLFLDADCESCAAVLAEAGHLAGRGPVAIRAILAGLPIPEPVQPETVGPGRASTSPAASASATTPAAGTTITVRAGVTVAAAQRAEAAGVPVFTGQRELFEAYGIPAVPFAVLVDPGGRIRLTVPIGSARAMRELVFDQAGDRDGNTHQPGGAGQRGRHTRPGRPARHDLLGRSGRSGGREGTW